MRRSIDGMLGLAVLALLALLAGGHGRQYAPRDRDALRAAAVELRSRGLASATIAAALGIAEAAVRQLLGDQP